MTAPATKPATNPGSLALLWLEGNHSESLLGIDRTTALDDLRSLMRVALQTEEARAAAQRALNAALPRAEAADALADAAQSIMLQQPPKTSALRWSIPSWAIIRLRDALRRYREST